MSKKPSSPRSSNKSAVRLSLRAKRSNLSYSEKIDCHGRPFGLPRNDSIFHGYSLLLKAFGPQGWWPTTPPGSSAPRYHPGRPVQGLGEKEKLEICLGAILTQNTGWTNVEKVWKGIHSRRLLKFETLLKMPIKKLEPVVRSSGYFRQKAERLKGFLAEVASQSGGKFSRFLSGPLLPVRRRLLAIKGIGPETADSMLLYAAGYPVFVVDAYTRRIAQRWGVLLGNETYDEVQRIFTEALQPSPDIFGEYHALLVALAKKFCKKSPVCDGCPVKQICQEGQRHVGCHCEGARRATEAIPL